MSDAKPARSTARDARPRPILIHTRPRPRVLVYGFDPGVALRLSEFIPTVRNIAELAEVRQFEWDALITRSSLFGVAPHLFSVVQAPAGRSTGWVIEKWGQPPTSVEMHRGQVAEELLRYPGLPDQVAQLTHDILEPLVSARSMHDYFAVASNDPWDTTLKPFLATGDGLALAGRYKRPGGAEVWLLPEEVPDLVPWIRAALAEWHQLDPDRFPGLPDWSHEPQWQTPQECQRAAGLAALEAERHHIIGYLDRRAAKLRDELEHFRSEADIYERALLTADSAELVDAVIRALREIGFTVVNADEHAKPGDNLEDLHITDRDSPGWLAIAEVKGYTKGASTAAFQQLARFSKRYLQRTGTSPDAEWYVVNQFRKQDPSIRQPILHGKAEDVQTFADDGGLIIDTAVLLRTLEQVRSRSVTAAAARAHFRTSAGIVRAPDAVE